MDPHQMSRYGFPSIEESFENNLVNTTDHTGWSLSPTKFDSRCSPDSPLSSLPDHESFSTTLSSSQENYSAMRIFSDISPSPNFSLADLYQSSPCNFKGNHLVRDSSQEFANYSMERSLQQLEYDLMAPLTEQASTPSSAYDEIQQPETSGQQLRSWDVRICTQGNSLMARHQPPIAGQHAHIYDGSHQLDAYQGMRRISSLDMPPISVKQLLIECAKALDENRMADVETFAQAARNYVSISGEPIQRLGAYLLESLVARKEDSGTNIYRTLRCSEPAGSDLLSYMRILYDICPYIKFSYEAANGAIAEAIRNEDHIHIIDFQIAQGTQWVTLIHALEERRPAHLRITGIDDPASRYARGDGLQLVGKRLADISEKFNISFEFHPVSVLVSEVTIEMLDVRPGEAVAVNFPLQLHHMPDGSVDMKNPRDGLLRMVKALSPKVITLIEQESNTNTTPFLARFTETLDYYEAMFESIDVALPKDNKDRISVEQHCLAKEIVNVIACEGKNRVERHELLAGWRLRMAMAGLRPFPLSSHVNSVIKLQLGYYSSNYTLTEEDGAMFLGWKNRKLISASAWH